MITFETAIALRRRAPIPSRRSHSDGTMRERALVRRNGNGVGVNMAGSIRRRRPGRLTLRVVGIAAGLLALTATATACGKAPVWQEPGQTGSTTAAPDTTGTLR